MSSDSGESHVSAGNDDGKEAGAGDTAPESTAALGSVEEQSISTDHGTEETEGAAQELQGGVNGMSFARRGIAQKDEEKSSVSELPMRSLSRRPGSPESTSTPDDTPSIHVGALNY